MEAKRNNIYGFALVRKERKLKRKEFLFKLQRSDLWEGLLIRRENRDYLEWILQTRVRPNKNVRLTNWKSTHSL